ncbi:MAG TPA: hypothetical protein VNK89_01560 [Thermoflexus sp.]|nr:hypothetical protein [Thermoflexus sp.]
MEVFANDLNRLRESFTHDGDQSVIALAITVFVGIALLLVSLVAQASLVSTTGRALQNQDTDLRQSIREGIGFLRPFLAITLMLYGPYFLISLFLGQALFVTNFTGVPFILAIAVFYPLGIVLTAVHLLAQRSLILQSLGVWSSIVNGWQFLWRYLGRLIVITLILIVIALLYSFVLNLILPPISVTSMLSILFAWLQTGKLTSGQILYITGMGLLDLVPNAPINAYQSIVITLAYFRFSELGRAKKNKRW